MTWDPWSQADERGLARYVIADAVQEIHLRENRLDLAQQRDGRCQLIQSIYNALLEKKVHYSPEKYQYKLESQKIRTPKEILDKPGDGTCLDLTTLFCGLCLGSDLLPLIIVIEGHALAAVSLVHGRRDWDKPSRKERQYFEKGLLKDVKLLCELIDNGTYLPIECTSTIRRVGASGCQLCHLSNRRGSISHPARQIA
jgi:hypothetical protein